MPRPKINHPASIHTSLAIDKEIYKQLQMIALDRSVPVKTLVNEAIAMYLKSVKTKNKK